VAGKRVKAQPETLLQERPRRGDLQIAGFINGGRPDRRSLAQEPAASTGRSTLRWRRLLKRIVDNGDDPIAARGIGSTGKTRADDGRGV
jgi:hypothetical protein